MLVKEGSLSSLRCATHLKRFKRAAIHLRGSPHHSLLQLLCLSLDMSHAQQQDLFLHPCSQNQGIFVYRWGLKQQLPNHSDVTVIWHGITMELSAFQLLRILILNLWNAQSAYTKHDGEPPCRRIVWLSVCIHCTGEICLRHHLDSLWRADQREAKQRGSIHRSRPRTGPGCLMLISGSCSAGLGDFVLFCWCLILQMVSP
jgi:hypothetical protein